jgi:hypothetical protein
MLTPSGYVEVVEVRSPSESHALDTVESWKPCHRVATDPRGNPLISGGRGDSDRHHTGTKGSWNPGDAFYSMAQGQTLTIVAPDANVTGLVSFDYVMHTGQATSNAATITVQTNPPLEVPYLRK